MSEQYMHWLRPGATHHARYPAKMFPFSDQVGYSKDMVDKPESLFRCNAMLYVEKWLSSSFGDDAPYNDLLQQLCHYLNDYKKHDTRVGLLFPVQLLKHLRGTCGITCITEECAVFPLFPNRLPDSERHGIARRLNGTPVPKKFIRWFLILIIVPQLEGQRCLAHPVPVPQWQLDPDY